MATQILSNNLMDRLEQARDADEAYCEAERRFYEVTERLEKLTPDLFRELDDAWIAVFLHAQRVAWNDGAAVGGNSALLAQVMGEGGGHE